MKFSKSKTKKRGFTLIELLIVVAIIAILAAIAVPNFLEAQTRSKVSRAKADMRTIRTGLESYAVDTNHYIIDYNALSGTPADDEYTTWVTLTTPISYLTSVLFTPFQSNRPDHDNNPYGDKNVYEYWGDPFFHDPPAGARASVVDQLGFKWIMGNLGPNLERDFIGVDAVDYVDLERGEALIYDPTNGTISSGDILSSNKEPFH